MKGTAQAGMVTDGGCTYAERSMTYREVESYAALLKLM